MLSAPQDALSAELFAAHEREAALAKELGKVKAENAELQTKLQKLSQSLKTAKVTAREALVDMADQNAKLVQAFVDKKRECKQLKASAREDRRTWQQRLQTMQLELQANKQHIQQLMQQLHAITAKQSSPAAAVTPVQHSSPALRSHSSLAASFTSRSAASTASGQSYAAVPDDSSMGCGQDEATSRMQQPSPLADATNRLERTSSWQEQSNTLLHPDSCLEGSHLKGFLTSRRAPAGAENRPPTGVQQEGTAFGKAAEPLQQQPQQDSSQLRDVQQQFTQLQQRAQQLEAENAQLRSAQAVAAAQIDTLKLTQQAEQLKQHGNRCFQAQDYQQAVAAYTEALALGVQDNSLTAVLLCNRAAAQHAGGQFLDAISDCCLAHQLDPQYPRALQRRAEAYLAVQHYSAAVADLQKLQQLQGANKEVAARLASAQSKQRVHSSVGPNHYLILGLEAGASTAEVKTAYKRLALKHHPDKASGPEAKSAAEAVFVLITAANCVLSDPSKRAAYDAAYARSSLLYGHANGYVSRAGTNGSSSSVHRNSSSGGSGSSSSYAWQHTGSSTFTAATQAATTAARAATAAATAAAAAAAAARPHWQQSMFEAAARAAPAHSTHSSNSSSSCTSGATRVRHTATGMRL